MLKLCLIELQEFENLGNVDIQDLKELKKTKYLPLIDLTEREKDILTELVKGKTNEEISKELYLSAFTVKNYVSRIIEKMEVKNRIQAAVKAIQFGLV